MDKTGHKRNPLMVGEKKQGWNVSIRLDSTVIPGFPASPNAARISPSS